MWVRLWVRLWVRVKAGGVSADRGFITSARPRSALVGSAFVGLWDVRMVIRAMR